MDKTRLLAEIRKRPVLWDSQRIDRSRKELAKKWQEVANSMGVSVAVCKNGWNQLRSCYYVTKKRYRDRKEKDKLLGIDDPKHKRWELTWKYAKDMSFVENVNKPKREVYITSTKATNQRASATKSYPSDIDDDNVRVEIEIDSDNDFEMDSFHHMEHEESNPVPNTEDLIILNDSDKDVEENLSITSAKDIEENISITSAKDVEENISIISAATSTQYITDPDNNFLISFSSQMKSMTQLQNLQFRVKMSDLVLSILQNTPSQSSNESKENNMSSKALVDINDPDCNFLISFLPYMKNMTQLENLKLRAEISELILSILSKNDLSNDN